MYSHGATVVSIICAVIYWGLVSHSEPVAYSSQNSQHEVVLPATAQVVLYGGDRFLAANVEAIRAAASSTTKSAHAFSLLAHQTVSRLNPCHEDNYWIGNASLSWGGAEEEGFELLRNAAHCRYWDEWPAFFYGFNQNFFLHNVDEAREYLELAALRSPANAAAFRTFSTMLAVGELDDTRMALEMLTNERDKASDPKLREMLNRRVTRLEGLLTLRNAQKRFEARFNKPLQRPQELLEKGILQSFPSDPMGIGYEFREQAFHLKQMKIN